MRLERQTRPEHLKVLRAYVKTRPEGRRYRRYEYLTYLGLAIVICFGLMGILFAWSPTMSPWWFATVPLVGLALWHPIWRMLDNRSLTRFIESNRAELGHQEFWIDASGFGNSTPAGSTFHVWSVVRAVEETPELGFVIGGAHLYSIPKDVRPEEVSAFMQELTKRWKGGGAVEQGVEADEAR